jgi:murein DD-endopeptidase MepM/ murein hydrolase activator NlpD
MILQRKRIIFYFIIVLLIAWGSSEAQYINRTKFLIPIESKEKLRLRDDSYGKGYFGAKRSGRRKHNGIDILAKVGTPVLATRSGRVINAEKKQGIGNYVEIRHSRDLISIYGHLSELLVKKGQRVRQGQIIGKVGKTGNANYKNMSSHLHFEIRWNNIPQNPERLFKEGTF